MSTNAALRGLPAPHTDPLTGFASREQLLADLAEALQPARPPSVVAVFDLSGLTRYERVLGQAASDALVARLARRFARVVTAQGACYRSREDEFWVVLSTRVDEARALLGAAAAALTEHVDSLRLTPSFGAVTLPAGVVDPIEVLMLADERLATAAPRRTRPDRRRTAREAEQGAFDRVANL